MESGWKSCTCLAEPAYQLPGRPWRILDVLDKRKAVGIGVPDGDPEGHGEAGAALCKEMCLNLASWKGRTCKHPSLHHEFHSANRLPWDVPRMAVYTLYDPQDVGISRRLG